MVVKPPAAVTFASPASAHVRSFADIAAHGRDVGGRRHDRNITKIGNGSISLEPLAWP
jgi:hypothetical protein